MTEPSPFDKFEDEMMTCWFCLEPRPALDQCLDGVPDRCLGMLADVDSACCGHGFMVPYVRFTDGRARLDAGDALDYFNAAGKGPKASELYRHMGDLEYRLLKRHAADAAMEVAVFEVNTHRIEPSSAAYRTPAERLAAMDAGGER